MRGTVAVDKNDCAQLTSRPNSRLSCDSCYILDFCNRLRTIHILHSLPWNLYDLNPDNQWRPTSRTGTMTTLSLRATT